MTNKLEEVFKELQESHVLVDREEYEQLFEKAEMKNNKPKNKYDELLESFEVSKAEMTNEDLQKFTILVLKLASSIEESNKFIDNLLAEIKENEKVGE